MVKRMIDSTAVNEIISDWPEKPRQVADQLIQKYGLPDEATPSMLIWRNQGPWKRTILHREEVPHQFPRPHTDLLEQVIDYRVPTDKFDELAAFDGSVTADRTRGEIAAHCDREEMNMLALNLAHEIINGKRNVDDARKAYAENAMAAMSQPPSQYMQQLQFTVPQAGTADPDQPIMATTMGTTEVPTGQPMGTTQQRVGAPPGAAEREGFVDVQKSINVSAPVERVFEIWSNFDNSPRFMSNIEEVKRIDGQRSHWKAKGPLGMTAEWNSVLTEYVPNQVIAWSSVPDSEVENIGRVLFQPNPDGSTRVDMRLSYKPKGGAVGRAVSSLFGANPEQQIEEDLNRMKHYVESTSSTAMGGAGTETGPTGSVNPKSFL